MTTAKAIKMLREKLGLTQERFAERFDGSPYSVSRYEKGEPPSREVMRKLAAIAAAAHMDDVREFFESGRRIDIKASIENRRSAGTGCHVPLSDLKMWSAHLRTVVDSVQEAMRQTNPEFKIAAMMNARVTADFLRDDIQLYIGEDPTHTSSALQQDDKKRKEDKHLLRAYVKTWEQHYFEQPLKKGKQ